MLTLLTPIAELTRVGKTVAARLATLGLDSAQDLLYHFPFRYDDFGTRRLIADLRADTVSSLTGTIDIIESRHAKNRHLTVTEAFISDESGQVKVIWFNQPFLTQTFKAGDRVALAGKIEEQYGQLVMISPQYEKNPAVNEGGETVGLVPIYSTTAGITQKQLRFLVRQVLPLAGAAKDWLPSESRQSLKLLSLKEALLNIHFPKNQKILEQARQRLAFDELLLSQLKARRAKKDMADSAAEPLLFFEEETRALVASLPFQLTDDQKKAAWEIIRDLQKDKPMARLLGGDVGSGKTLVAALALFNTALSGRQGALMVPTEILAGQHYQSFLKTLKGFPIKIALCTNSRQEANFSITISEKSAKNRKNNLIKLFQEEADIVIGTQALIQERINLPRLSLAIVDEQHRFGVRQRQHLGHGQDVKPHFLSMTATPIPRSLALALYGNLKVSLIRQKPADRLPITTSLIDKHSRDKTYKFIRAQINSGRQAFIICPLVEESDTLGVKAATVEKERLEKEIFPDLKVGLVHGRLKAAEKEKIMAAFAANEIQILVATAVVEVGVDVPNATVIVIEGAARFGLAQLHQFRGRVGRSQFQSYCFLSPGEDNKAVSAKTRERLLALTKHQDGFALAEIDLKLRGAGDWYGTIQSGDPEFKVASPFDYSLIKQAQAEADRLLKLDPSLKRWPDLKKILEKEESQVHWE
jgi:ATP-dependent DNA helicase RecG